MTLVKNGVCSLGYLGTSHLDFQVQRLLSHFYHYFECVNYMSGSIAPYSFHFTSSEFTSTPFSTQFLLQFCVSQINHGNLNPKHKLNCSSFNENGLLIPPGSLFPLKQPHLFFSIIGISAS